MDVLISVPLGGTHQNNWLSTHRGVKKHTPGPPLQALPTQNAYLMFKDCEATHCTASFKVYPTQDRKSMAYFIELLVFQDSLRERSLRTLSNNS